MSRTQFVQDLFDLYLEKNIRLTPASVRYFQDISLNLAEQGVPLTREILDFCIDLVHVMAIVGVRDRASDLENADTREKIIEWLEVLGWRRAWFATAWGGQHITSGYVHSS
jgi:hypothetical protein